MPKGVPFLFFVFFKSYLDFQLLKIRADVRCFAPYSAINKKIIISMSIVGKKIWAIAEGYIPSASNGPEPQMTSHETACILNTSDQEANIKVTLYFTDRDPVGPYKITVAPRRTKHVRFNDLKEPESVPFDTDYASIFESDVPVVIQHTRLDSRQSENALMTTIAFYGD
jgi:hypothetical protein